MCCVCFRTRSISHVDELHLTNGEIWTFEFPPRFTVDKVKDVIFQRIPSLKDCSRSDYQLSLSIDDRIDVEFVQFPNCHSSIKNSFATTNPITINLKLYHRESKQLQASPRNVPPISIPDFPPSPRYEFNQLREYYKRNEMIISPHIHNVPEVGIKQVQTSKNKLLPPTSARRMHHDSHDGHRTTSPKKSAVRTTSNPSLSISSQDDSNILLSEKPSSRGLGNLLKSISRHTSSMFKSDSGPNVITNVPAQTEANALVTFNLGKLGPIPSNEPVPSNGKPQFRIKRSNYVNHPRFMNTDKPLQGVINSGNVSDGGNQLTDLKDQISKSKLAFGDVSLSDGLNSNDIESVDPLNNIRYDHDLNITKVPNPIPDHLQSLSLEVNGVFKSDNIGLSSIPARIYGGSTPRLSSSITIPKDCPKVHFPSKEGSNVPKNDDLNEPNKNQSKDIIQISPLYGEDLSRLFHKPTILDHESDPSLQSDPSSSKYSADLSAQISPILVEEEGVHPYLHDTSIFLDRKEIRSLPLKVSFIHHQPPLCEAILPSLSFWTEVGLQKTTINALLDPDNLTFESEDHSNSFYRTYFVNHAHTSFIGLDKSDQPFIVAVMIDRNQSATAIGILKMLVLSKKGSELHFLDQHSLSHGTKLKVPQIQEALKWMGSDFHAAKLRQIKSPNISSYLSEFEERQEISRYKFGILFVGENQVTEDEMFSNESGSDLFDDFLDLMGDRIRLKGFKGYPGGLDTECDRTGLYAIYTRWRKKDIMFHVSTMLPFSDDEQQLERKRHLGNDIVLIIFKEGNTPYSPDVIKSEFIHVVIVVQPERVEDRVLYRVSVAAKNGVPPISPLLPESALFERTHVFREVMLIKLLNAEWAAYKSPNFSAKFQRIRLAMLSEIESKCK